jgi:hypothetical protein
MDLKGSVPQWVLRKTNLLQAAQLRKLPAVIAKYAAEHQ